MINMGFPFPRSLFEWDYTTLLAGSMVDEVEPVLQKVTQGGIFHK